MSITFAIAGCEEQVEEESCMCAQDAPRFLSHVRGEVSIDEIRGELADHAWDECRVCKGTGVITVSVPAEGCAVNLANDNARAMMRLMGLVPDYCGTIRVEELPAVIRRLMRAVNSEGTRGAFVKEGQDIPATHGQMVAVKDGNVVRLERRGGTCRVVSGGRDDEYIARTAGRLLDMCRRALSEGKNVIWG